jgi:hypothetical protein
MIKCLGQVASAVINTNYDLYTVPVLCNAVCSTLTICNTTGNSAKQNVAVRINGEAITTKNYLYYGVTVASNGSLFTTIGITLKAGDIVTVSSDKVGVAFHLYGEEFTT